MKRMPSGLVFARFVALAALLVLGAHAQAQTDALPYHLDVGGLDGRLGRGDLGADDPTPRLVAQTSGAPATAGATTTEPEGPEESASALNRKLTNPVSDLWSITNEFNNFKLENGHWNNNWNFQPVLPLSLTRDVNLITRPVMPFYNIVPHETAPGQFERTAGLGDLTLLELLSPAHSGHWVLGAGPTFIFPTATSKFTGQGKVQIGPAVVAGYLTKRFFLGVFPQQWFSIGGAPARPDTSPAQFPAHCEPLLWRRLERGVLGQYPGELEGVGRGRLDSAHRPQRGQGGEAGAGARQVRARAAVHACAPPERPGVERAGQDHSCPPKAHQGHPVRVTPGNEEEQRRRFL
jgi:hypothetical protein